MSQFGSSYHPGYVSGNGEMQYSPVATNFANYQTAYLQGTTHGTGYSYLPTNNTSMMPYQVRPPPRNATLPSQHRGLPHPSFYSPVIQNHPSSQTPYRYTVEHSMFDTEEQDSPNVDSMRSEPVEPPLDGYPNVNEFDTLVENYVKQLSPKKQDKALIHAKRAGHIKTVLLDKKTTAIGSAQFRFWVKKMFTLLPNDPSTSNRKRRICHEGKPVAVREKLFKILTKAHQKCQHGGRDKTSAQVRKVYSWVPKELISRFVKICPTCQVRRGIHRGAASDEEEDSPRIKSKSSESPGTASSPLKSRRGSSVASYPSSTLQSPVSLVGGSPAFQNQNRWMSDYHTSSTFNGATSANMLTTCASNEGLHLAAMSMDHSQSYTSDLYPSSRHPSTHGSMYKQEGLYRHK